MYYIVYGIFYLLSLLPFWVLHLFSDFAYCIIYYGVGYRKDVVMKNLLQAFPDKTNQERVRLAKAFYHNFTDNFIETIKLISASPAFLKKHFTGDFSLCDQLYESGRKCQLLVGHNFNWEMAMLRMPLDIRHKFLVVYLKLSSPLFERLIYKIRTRNGAVMLPATEMKQAIAPHLSSQYMLVLGADQNPGSPRSSYWLNFFGKLTPFVSGPEKASRKDNIPILFCKFLKKKRGYYEIVFEMGAENPASLPEGEITKRYVQFLQQFITEHPEMWLWSHRRWKWEWKEEFGNLVQ